MSISVATERWLPGLVELDSQGTIIFFKWSGEEKLSQSQSDLVGRNFFSEVAPFDNVSELREYFDSFDRSSSPTNSFLFNCRYPDGSERVSILLARLGENQHPGRAGVVLMYIRKAA
jgi:PAS domain-containing protein